VIFNGGNSVKEDLIKNVEPRIKTLSAIVVAIFFLLVLKIWSLQIMQGANSMLKSRQNQTRVIRINAPRGIFYDRNGKIMVSSRTARNVMAIPDDVIDKPEVIKLLSKILRMPEREIRAKLKPDPKKPSHYSYQYVPIKKDVDPNTIVKLYEAKMNLPGVEVDPVPLRYYVNGEFASHLFGYIREINDRELETLKNNGYRLGDIIGKSGLEKTFEPYLKGVDGGIIFEVDIHDRPLRRLEYREPQPGNNLYLTLDYKLQKAAEQALEAQFHYLQEHSRFKKAQSGLVVALDPRNGDILALVSKPGYDPNVFVGPIPREVAKQLYNNPLKPFMNRVLQGEYAPGSTFKPLTVITALMEGKVTLEDRFYCNGYDPIWGRSFKCWTVTNSVKVPIHGDQNIIDGLKNSCNIVMAELGRRVGPDALARYARNFRFGKPTGINLAPGEKTGFVPDTDWKRRRFKERWYPLETAHFSIGQGFLTVTPLQLAQFYAGIANDGRIYRPRLVSKITNASGEQIVAYKPEVLADLKIAPEANAIVKQGMVEVVSIGTAASLFRGFPVDRYPVAGKTGTAQKPPYDSNGLFACFAPANHPEIVVAVVVEQGGSSSAAAPVARKVLEAYFNIKYPRPKPAAAKPPTAEAAATGTARPKTPGVREPSPIATGQTVTEPAPAPAPPEVED
jgi:penicillin-binding protein 2